MKKILQVLNSSPLFAGCREEFLQELTEKLNVKICDFEKEEFVLHQGQMPEGIGLVLTGKLLILREDYLGNREILAEVTEGEIFDEVYGILKNEPQRVAVIAAEYSKTAFFTIDSFLAAGAKEPVLVKNLLRVLARKNLFLTAKMAHLSKRTTREKMISYLSEMRDMQPAGKMGEQIRIPFNRQQLADYLAVDRAALSRELSRMQEEGLIEYHKNLFILKQ